MKSGHNMIYIDYVIYHVRNEFYKMVSFITGLKARVFSQRIRKWRQRRQYLSIRTHFCQRLTH